MFWTVSPKGKVANIGKTSTAYKISVHLDYFPYWKDGRGEKYLLRDSDVLTHCGGISGAINFYKGRCDLRFVNSLPDLSSLCYLLF